MIARGTLNLFSAQPFIALQVLFAMRAREFKLAHAETVSADGISAIADYEGTRRICPCAKRRPS